MTKRPKLAAGDPAGSGRGPTALQRIGLPGAEVHHEARADVAHSRPLPQGKAQSLPAEPDAPRPAVAESSGFSLHAGIAAQPSQPDKLERLARYISRPPVATDRLALTGSGHVRYALKTPYRDGTTHVIFEPEDFIARLAALVPKPRAHLTRYHGVFAIDIETCRQCGGRLRVIACIEQPALIDRLLAHLGCSTTAVDPTHPSRAPPGQPRLI